jgi:muramoyltetrapeptide carboxypeptidase
MSLPEAGTALTPPPWLESASVIRIVATARRIGYGELHHAVQYLQNEGFQVELAKGLFEVKNQFAGTDEVRRRELQAALDDRRVAAILCARGGYGTTRMLDGIDWQSFRAHPKWIVGFSDVTALLAQVYRLGFQSMHGSMAMTFNPAEYDLADVRRLVDALRGHSATFQAFAAHPSNRLGTARGRVVGGNLSMLVNQIGTPTDIDTDQTILFIEDLDEYYYHVDRMFQHLYRAGKFDNLAGLIIGSFTQMKDNSIPFGETIEQMVNRVTKGARYPVLFGFPAGHGRRNWPLRIGALAELSVQPVGTRLQWLD